MWPFKSPKPGEALILSDGAEGTIKEEVWGNRVIVERIGNLSGKPIEVVLDKGKIRNNKGHWEHTP